MTERRTEFTEEEERVFREAKAKFLEQLKKEPYSFYEVACKIIQEIINDYVFADQESLRMKSYYPTYDKLVEKKYTTNKIGFKFIHKGDLYKTRQPSCNFNGTYEPGATGTESLYERIDEIHDGSKYDPIPYEGNMTLEQDKYYTQNNELYFCHTGSGIAVFQILAELENFVRKVVD